MDRIAACKGGSLVLGCDLSRQLVASPELQALIREAGLPVELHFNHLYEDLNIDDWFRLDVPVRHRAVCSDDVHDYVFGPLIMLHSLPGYLGHPVSVKSDVSLGARIAVTAGLCHSGARLSLAH